MPSFDSIEAYAYGKSKGLMSEKQEIKHTNTIQNMIIFDDIAKENIKEHNPN